MICEHARLAIGAAPEESTPDLEAHLATCGDCRAYRVESRALNERIRRAMQLPPPGTTLAATPQVGIGAPAAAQPPRTEAPAWRRGWALAAGVLLAAVAVMLLSPTRTGSALASDLVQHLSEQHSRGSWDNTEVVAQGVLDKVLRQAGVTIAADAANPVVFAHSCVLRSRTVPHLVIRTGVGPLTVVPLVGERVPTTQSFHEGGFSGVLVPQQGGAVAVLARGTTDLQDIATEIGQRIRLTP